MFDFLESIGSFLMELFIGAIVLVGGYELISGKGIGAHFPGISNFFSGLKDKVMGFFSGEKSPEPGQGQVNAPAPQYASPPYRSTERYAAPSETTGRGDADPYSRVLESQNFQQPANRPVIADGNDPAAIRRIIPVDNSVRQSPGGG